MHSIFPIHAIELIVSLIAIVVLTQILIAAMISLIDAREGQKRLDPPVRTVERPASVPRENSSLVPGRRARATCHL